MALPEPTPGLVFRYDYVWLREARKGQDTSKERPACVAVATDADISPRLVLILPITHSAPRGGTVGIEIPEPVRRALGLDDRRSWIVVSETNTDEWPNAGIAPVPGKETFAYGFLPPELFAVVKVKMLEHLDMQRTVKR